MEEPLGPQQVQLFDKYGLPCGRHYCLQDGKKLGGFPQYICKGDKVYKQIMATRQYQEMI